MNKDGHGWRHAFSGVALILFSLAVSVTHAAQLLVVQSDDSAPYAATSEALEQSLSSDWNVKTITQSELTTIASDMVVAVGSAACGHLHDTAPDSPLLCLLTPKTFHQQLSARSRSDRFLSAIYIDQPDERQLRVARQLFPKLRRFALLHHDEHPPPLISARPPGSTELHAIPLNSNDNLVRVLRSELPSVDALLAIPDKRIYNRNTLRSILLTTYRARKPLIGYAKPFVNAGALMSLYTPPAAVGKQAANWLNNYLKNGRKLPPPAFPQFYAIAINSNIAKALQLPIDASEYEGRLFDAGEAEQ